MKPVPNWQLAAKELQKIERLVLVMYFAALLGLLFFPIAGPGFQLLGIESDKWMHVALFGGLAVLLRWNLSAYRHAVFVAVGVAFVVAAVTEVAQGLVAYRSAELMDLVAGLVGAMLGATTVDRILSSPILQRLLGLLVVILGLMIGAFFLMADVIGVGDGRQIGLTQFAGMGLGAIIAFGGVKVYLTGLRGGSGGL